MDASGDIAGAKQGDATELNLGVRLRYAREARNLSLDDVAAELRIAVPSLKALEECRFDALGPPVFAKGYLRQYGARLGLDVKELVAAYERMVGTADVVITPSKTIKLRDARTITSWIVAGFALVLLAAVLSVWWLRQPGQLWGPPAVSPDSVASRESVASPPAVREPETARAEPEPDEPEPAADPVRTEPPAAAIATESGEPGPAVAEPAAEPADALAEAVFEGPAVEIVFVEDSWAEITSASGERLYYRLGQAGERARLAADDSLQFFFGNARGVELRLDGEAVAIPASARRGDLAQFELGDLRD
jgi:cytoskeleton protein RodZ